jgi:hypothetical protein
MNPRLPQPQQQQLLVVVGVEVLQQLKIPLQCWQEVGAQWLLTTPSHLLLLHPLGHPQ